MWAWSNLSFDSVGPELQSGATHNAPKKDGALIAAVKIERSPGRGQVVCNSGCRMIDFGSDMPIVNDGDGMSGEGKNCLRVIQASFTNK
jgi:hypothetical protein